MAQTDVTNLAATPGNGSVALAWSAVAGATSYTVLRATWSGDEATLATGVAGLAYTDSAVINGTTYFYRVLAQGVTLVNPVDEVSATPAGAYYFHDTTNGTNGTNLTAHAADFSPFPWVARQGTIQIQSNRAQCQSAPSFSTADTGAHNGTWVATVNRTGMDPADALVLTFRGTDGNNCWAAFLTGGIFAMYWLLNGSFVQPPNAPNNQGISPPGSTDHTITVIMNEDSISIQYDSNAALTITHNFNLTATQIGIYGRPSATFSAMSFTPLTASTPAGLTATGIEGGVKLAWTPQPGIAFNIRQATVAGQEAAVPVVANMDRSDYFLFGLPVGVTAFFKVSAITGTGETAQSPEISAQPIAMPKNTWRKIGNNQGNDPRIMKRGNAQATLEMVCYPISPTLFRFVYTRQYTTNYSTICMTTGRDPFNPNGPGVTVLGHGIGGEAAIFPCRNGKYVEGSNLYLSYNVTGGGASIRLAQSSDNGATWNRIATNMVPGQTNPTAQACIAKSGSTYVMSYVWSNASIFRCAIATSSSLTGPYVDVVPNVTLVSAGNIMESHLQLFQDSGGLWHGFCFNSPNASDELHQSFYHFTNADYTVDAWVLRNGGQAWQIITEAPADWIGLPVDQNADLALTDTTLAGAAVCVCHYDIDYNNVSLHPYDAEICANIYYASLGQMLFDQGGGTAPGTPVVPPGAVPMLAAVDNADGTGATATVTGSSSGSANSVYVQRIDAGFTALSWTLAATLTSDGAVSVPLAPGLYYVKVQSVLGTQTTLSNLAYTAVTDGKQAVHERAIQAVEAGLRLLATGSKLAGITLAQRIYDMQELDLTKMDLPGLAVLVGGNETEGRGSNRRDDIGYPVQIVLIDRSSGQYVANRPGYLQIRQVISRYFRQQHLGVVYEVFRVSFEPGPIQKFDMPDYQVTASIFILRCWSREPRG